MTDESIRIDANGDLRCYNCGSRNLTEQRKTGSKIRRGIVGGGVGALTAKKYLRCQACGVYNEPGNPVPIAAPADTHGPLTSAATEFVPPPSKMQQKFAAAEAANDRAKSQLDRQRAETQRLRAERAERKAAKEAAKDAKRAEKQAAKDAKRNR